MPESQRFDNINQRRLELPLSATYELKDCNSGFAEGKITVVVDDKRNSATDIIPYWADNNGILKDYTSLYPFRVTDETTVFEVEPNIIIPKGATRLLIFAQDYDDNQKITEDYIEIKLPESAASTEEWGEIITEFQVVSDTHVAETGYFNHLYIGLLNDIVNISPNSSGLFIAGDVTNNGMIAQYETHKALHTSVEGAPNYYIAIGNHEYFDGGVEATKTLQKRFASFARLPDGTSPNRQTYDFWLNGYHYIMLGNDGIESQLLNGILDDETMVWLRNALNENRNANRPCFIFCHFPIQYTVAGSLGEYSNGLFTGFYGENADKLRAVLKDFPEVVLFTGHEHFTLGYPNTMHRRNEKLPTVFNTASACLPTNCRDRFRKCDEGSEGYFVYVYEGKIILRGYDFINDKWIPSAYFYVDF